MLNRFLSVTLGGALFLMLPAVGALGFTPERELLPDGDIRPVVVSAELKTPGRHNRLLEADLAIVAYDNDSVIGYEYRWRGPTIGSAHPTALESPTVSYRNLYPEMAYALDVRAIDENNHRSAWFNAWRGRTPSVPNVIVAGDSIAAGYSRRWFTGDATCVDVDLSYGRQLAAEIATMLPSQWAPTYTNVAWAGAGLASVANGGTDSCGVDHASQLDRIRQLASSDTWNIVVMTAGINSTNWSDVIVSLTADATFSLTASGDKHACKSAVTDLWNIELRQPAITEAASIVSTAVVSDTNAQVLWTGYYDITDTEFTPLYRPITGVCSDEMEYALDALHDALRAGLADDVKWVDIDVGVSTQKWAGWPHPDSQGQKTIAHRIVLALNA